ncbi:MAG TPA: prolyl oligopeptidase family serine peptidase, partial [Longimicrobiales bacterium]|nr:prolyl oligopeptidase family serine peptidase [Longimicrobiales bacterium]
RAYARRWIGKRDDALQLARMLSPMSFVSPHTPPVVTVHGDRDATVPYQQSVRLHETLSHAGVPNHLFTVDGAGHGDFPEDVWARAYRSIFEFLQMLQDDPPRH